MKKPYRPLTAKLMDQAPPSVPPKSNLGPSLDAGGGAIRQGASLQGNQRKAMLMRMQGMKISGSG